MDTRELYSIEGARFVLGGVSRATIYDLLNSGVQLFELREPAGLLPLCSATGRADP